MDLREQRLTRGKSASEIAEEVGVTRATVSAWETGVSGMEPDRIAKVARAYGVKPAQLARYIVEKRRERKAQLAK